MNRIRNRYLRIFLRTAVQAVPTIAIIVVINFFFLRLAPGSGAEMLAAEYGTADETMMEDLRRKFGADLPLFQQFTNYIVRLAQFDLGFSPLYNQPVLNLIVERLPGTLILMGCAMVIALSMGLLCGTIMAIYENRWPDRVLSFLMLLLYSLPSFWFALIIILIFALNMGLLPTGGYPIIEDGCNGLCVVGLFLRHLILPAGTLALFYAAIYARVMRTSVREMRLQNFVRTATAKGASKTRVVIRHVIPNALLPVIAVAGTHLGHILGGSVMVETVFSWPGFGRLAFEAISKRDFDVLIGIFLFSSIVVVVANLIVDLLQVWIDPRIEVK